MALLTASAAVLALLAGCSAGSGADSGSEGSGTATASVPPPQLSEPVTVDFFGRVVADNGADRALVADYTDGRFVTLDASGRQLWTHPAQIDMDGGSSVAAYTYRDTVIIDDGSGRVRALNWQDGSPAWDYMPPPETRGCSDPTSYATAASTGTADLDGEAALLLLEHTRAGVDAGSCTAGEKKAMLIGLDPATGKEALPAVQAAGSAKPAGGKSLAVAPSHDVAYLPWNSDGRSLLSRVRLADGRHATVDLTRFDADGVGFTVYPQSKSGSLVYRYASADGDDPIAAMMARTAGLQLPAQLPESSGELAAPQEGGTQQGRELSFDDEPENRCAAEPRYTAGGTPVCADMQLFASRIMVIGSQLDGKPWAAEVPEAAGNSGLFAPFGALPSVPVDGPKGPLLIMPGLKAGVRAVSASDGSTVWESGAPLKETDPESGRFAFAGNGALADLDLIPVLYNDAVHFLTPDGKEHGSAHAVDDYAEASATGRWFAAAAGEKTTFWAVTGG